MQTFLPYPDFKKSASVLDNARLGKQRLEAVQIIRANRKGEGGWINHPAVVQWRGYEYALRQYLDACITEWVLRGFNNTMCRMWLQPHETPIMPPWLGDKRYHASHRAVLLYKAPDHYSQFGWTETPEYNYYWPSKNGY